MQIAILKRAKTRFKIAKISKIIDGSLEGVCGVPFECVAMGNRLRPGFCGLLHFEVPAARRGSSKCIVLEDRVLCGKRYDIIAYKFFARG